MSWRPRLQLSAIPFRSIGLGLALIVATGLLLHSVQRHYPIQKWLFWRYAGYWLAAGIWSLSCAASGHRLLRLILSRPLPWLEQLAVGQALGVFAFQLVMFVLGLAQLYHPVTFFALPLVFLAIGGRPFLRSITHAYARFRSARLVPGRLSPLAWVAILFGVVSLLALYLPVMAAHNSSFDARWRHLYIAEQYVVFGGIRPFREGWSLGASPHFTSLLYAWGSMFPGGLLFDRIELCAHIEFVVFLWTTLAGVPALVRRLIPSANPAIVWASRFLFPGTFLYDSNLSVGADHIGAVFAPALFLCCVRMWRDPSPRRGLLLGLFIAAAVCAKETTALLLTPFPIVMVAVRFAVDLGWAALAGRGFARLRGSVIAGTVTVLFTAPHWLKNLLWYGDPLYPNLHRYFATHSANIPWSPNAAYTFEYGFKTMLWAPEYNLAGLREALETLFTFSFVPHSWWSMHRDVPVLGSLFTLMLLVLPFLRGTRRLWMLVACVHLSVFAWFWVHHEDRHLQALVPWMAAGVAASATLVWRYGHGLTRSLLALLILAQAVWGADVYFIPTHSMTTGAALKAPMELLAKGYLGNYEQRFDIQVDQVRIGKLLPKHSVLLVHERRDHLGFGRTTVTDVIGDQYGIDYLALGSPDRIYARLRELGVSHVAWLGTHSEGFEPLAGDIAFFEFVNHYTRKRRQVGAYSLAELGPKPPPRPEQPRRVAVYGCGTEYATGVYWLSDLKAPRFGPKKERFRQPRETFPPGDSSWRDRVFAIAVEIGCDQPNFAKAIHRNFERVARRGDRWGRGHEIWLRKQ